MSMSTFNVDVHIGMSGVQCILIVDKSATSSNETVFSMGVYYVYIIYIYNIHIYIYIYIVQNNILIKILYHLLVNITQWLNFEPRDIL